MSTEESVCTNFERRTYLEVWPVAPDEIPMRYLVTQSTWLGLTDGTAVREVIAWRSRDA